MRKGPGATYAPGSGTTAGDMAGRYHLAFVNVKIAIIIIIIIIIIIMIINFPPAIVLS